MSSARPALQVLEGGAAPLGPERSDLLRRIATVVRRLSPEQTATFGALIREFSADDYLERSREFDPAVVKILAEVISGWDEEAVFEFARSWASTLVARRDGFDWDVATPEEKQRHWARVGAELSRRGLL